MWAHYKRVTLKCLNADMTVTRCVIALGSFLCGLILLGNDDVLARRGSDFLRIFFANDETYAALFFGHWIGAMWRIYDPVERPGWSMLVNILGFVLVFTLTIGVILGFGFWTLQSGFMVSLSAASFWNVVRTGNGSAEVGP